MSKLSAVIRREYVQGVRSKAFIISTILGPILLMVFTVVPGLLFSMKTGGATRIAVVDETGRLYESARESIMRDGDEQDENEEVGAQQGANSARSVREEQVEVSYEVERAAPAAGETIENLRKRLDERVERRELDGYVVLPPDVLETGRARFYARNLSDVVTIGRLERRLSRAVREQRMRDANIRPEQVRAISREIEMSRHKPGQQGEENKEGSFFLALAVGMFVYIAILMYGQAILSAVVEEKTTRIVEVLFSSVKAFTLMGGKLVGVSLVGLTQYVIWAVVFVGAGLYGAGALGGMEFNFPRIPVSFALYALLYFLLGFYVYATLYAVVGAMVTTEKEGGQLAFPVILLLMAGIYMAFPVIRSPSSDFAFWVSMIPFFSPITMVVRIVTETPPFWQIALSLAIGILTVVGLVWVAARIYRTGMLMYGKRATIPEVLRWVRQD